MPQQINDTAATTVDPREAGPIERCVKLPREDWGRVSFRPRSAEPATAPPLYFEAFLARALSRHLWRWCGGQHRLLGEMIPVRPSREEAWLWLLCLESGKPLRGTLRAAHRAGPPDDATVRARVLGWVGPSSDPLAHGFLYDAPQVLRPFFRPLVIAELIVSKPPPTWHDGTPWAVHGFARFIAPQLPEDERSSLRSALEQAYDAEPDHSTPRAQLRLALLATVGGGARLAAHVAGLDTGAWRAPRSTAFQHLFGIESSGHLEMLAGLADEAHFVREARRLGCMPRGPSDLRLWLAATAWRELDIASAAVIAAGNKAQAAAMVRVLGLVEAPETAPAMLAVQLDSRAPAAAGAWLSAHPLLAAVGLVPTAMRQGKLAQAAREHLHVMRRSGSAAVLAAAQRHLDPEQGAWLRREILAVQEESLAEVDRAQLPAPLSRALHAIKTRKPPGWISLCMLPPIRIQGGRLGDDEVTAILTALREKPGAATPSAVLITQLKTHADLASLDAFAWGLFELWQSKGAASNDRWAMQAIGRLGGAGCVLKLTPLLRTWPGEGRHARAVLGLSCLRMIGSDAALSALNSLASQPRFRKLQRHAREVMHDVARARGLTPVQVADRLMPHCGLDARGTRAFDFGPRQFHFVMGADLKPLVRDPSGKLHSKLPAPTKTDDPGKAATARQQWKLLKKTLRQELRLQAARLEDAMVSGRRWSPDELRTFLLQHPVTGPLVRQLVLAAYDDDGKISATFRVTEDQTFADSHDEPISLPASGQIGVAHPAHLDEARRLTWSEVLGDYKIVPPFPQMGRDILRPHSEDLERTAITRCRGRIFRKAILSAILERHCWLRAPSCVAGFLYHTRYFAHANVTAFLRYTGYVHGERADPRTLEAVYFVAGQVTPASQYEPARIRDVDPAVLSEVLLLAQALVAEAK